MTTPSILTPSQAARIAGCCHQTILRAIQSNQLPAEKHGANHVIRPSALQAWLDRRKPAQRMMMLRRAVKRVQTRKR